MTKFIRKPKAGDPISAKAIGSLIDIARGASQLTVAGGDAFSTTSGQAVAVPRQKTLRIAEVTSDWTKNEGEPLPRPYGPAKWYFATAKFITLYKTGWAVELPERQITIWAPTLTARNESGPVAPPSIAPGNWVFVTYQNDVWVVVGTSVSRPIPFMLAEQLESGSYANADIVDVAGQSTGVTIKVFDHPLGLFYGTVGTPGLALYDPEFDRFVVIAIGCSVQT